VSWHIKNCQSILEQQPNLSKSCLKKLPEQDLGVQFEKAFSVVSSESLKVSNTLIYKNEVFLLFVTGFGQYD